MNEKSILSLWEKASKKAIDDYLHFLSFPSVSSEKKHEGDVKACVHWLKNYMESMGLKTELIQTSGHPTLLAGYEIDPDKPTLLLYGHYDVQPVDPIELWQTPPFSPVIRDGSVFARGAQDNKGQIFYCIQAVKYLLEEEGTLPLNIKFLIEGEEETGSLGLSKILPSIKDSIKADYVVVVDVGIPAKDEPAITLGLRGIITFDIHLKGSKNDLHSGMYGGLAYNPNHALVKVLASLRDENGKIAIPNFYDDVKDLSALEREEYDLEFDDMSYLAQTGFPPTGGEETFSPGERRATRPTLEINGINGGYTGDGFKTVIPKEAHAKISCRLVPNQDPEKIGLLVKNHIQKIVPKGIEVEVDFHLGKGMPVRLTKDSSLAKAFAESYESIFKKKCRYILEGASIPIAAELKNASGGDLLLVGLGLPEDLIHAPNENFSLDRFKKGFCIIAGALFNLASVNKQ